MSWMRCDEEFRDRLIDLLKLHHYDDDAKKIESNFVPGAGGELIERARDLHAIGSDNDIEVDDDAPVSEGDEGDFVGAWVWVPHENDEEEDEENE